MRKPQLGRKSRLPRSTKPIPRKKRAPAETRRIYGTPQRIAWVKAHPCLVCSTVPSENAHVVGGGTSRKADADQIVPLCHHHHIETLHRIGVEPFERLYAFELGGHTLAAHAARIANEWDELEDIAC